MNVQKINVLLAIRLQASVRFREGLAKESQLAVSMVTSIEAARERLEDPDNLIDVLVVDNGFGYVFELIKELRQSHPSLLIILLDEEADFGMPGRADDVSTDPFSNDELVRKIKRVVEERRLQTLRNDALPPVRTFAKSLRKASKGIGRQQAAVAAVQELGYDYVAYFVINPSDPPSLSLAAQAGATQIMTMMPPRSDATGLLGWVAQHGQIKIVGPNEQPNHFLVEKGKFGAAVCVPVGTSMRFGVLLACREQAGTIKPEGASMIELICAQLAHALAKDLRG